MRRSTSIASCSGASAFSDKRTLGLIVAWIVAVLVADGAARPEPQTLTSSEFQPGLFLAGLLIGLIWPTGRINIDFAAARERGAHDR